MAMCASRGGIAVARRLSSTASPPKVRWSTNRSSRPPSVKVKRARRWVSSGCDGLLDEQLTAHAQVGDQRRPAGRAVGLGHRQPQVLAAPVRGGERAAGQGGDEVVGALEVAADGARVVHLDRGDGAAGDPLLQAAADDLDLGQFGHGSGLGTASDSARQAASAASCSAAFLVRPAPRAVARCRPGGRRR